MDAEYIMAVLNDYGLLILFAISFLEHLNLPGFPAGVIMPAAGIWTFSSSKSLLIAVLIVTAGGILGSIILYFIGYKWGTPLWEKYLNTMPKYKDKILKYTDLLNKNSKKTIFITRIIPMIRTIISIPTGVLRMPISDYIFYSVLGMLIMNYIYIGSGYFFGEIALNYFNF